MDPASNGNLPRRADGTLMPGARLNNAGRKPGSSMRDKIRAAAEPYLDDAIQCLQRALNQKTVDSASVKAAIEILDRLAAKPRAPSSEPIRIEGFGDPNLTLTDKARLVDRAVQDGTITPEQAHHLNAALAHQAQVVKVDELSAVVREALKGADIDAVVRALKQPEAKRLPKVIEPAAEPAEDDLV